MNFDIGPRWFRFYLGANRWMVMITLSIWRLYFEWYVMIRPGEGELGGNSYVLEEDDPSQQKYFPEEELWCDEAST
jgi:hypothetical protein